MAGRGTIANYTHAKLRKLIEENSAAAIGDITNIIAGTGLDGGAESGEATLTLDLTEVIASDGANRILTSDADGTLTAEQNFSFDGTTLFVTGSAIFSGSTSNGTFPVKFINNGDSGEFLSCISPDGNPSIELRQGAGGNGGIHLYDDDGNSRLYLEAQTNPKIMFKNSSAGTEGLIQHTADDFLTISGSSGGIALSGSTIQIDGILEGASPLRIGGEMQFISQGDSSAFKFGPSGEAKIFYGNDEYLNISGSAAGLALSGSHVSIDGKLGVGVFGSDITNGITLPNSSQADGQVKASAFTSYSSRRYKENIKKLKDPLKVIQSLKGVSYDWKDSGYNDFGFIAEDVGQILPGIVQWETNGKDAIGMDYMKIISFLVEAVKEQQVQIEKLNHRLDLNDEKIIVKTFF